MNSQFERRGLKTYLCAWIDLGIGQGMFSHAPFLKTFQYRGVQYEVILLFDCFHSDFAHSGKFLMHFNDWCEKFYLESKNIFVYSDTCCNPHY